MTSPQKMSYYGEHYYQDSYYGVEKAKSDGLDFVIVDTGGNVQINQDFMSELVEIKRQISPDEIILVLDSMTGQESVNVANTFNQNLELTGLVLTKLDGDARGGAALSIASVTGIPIKFIGVGENTDALEMFYPDRIASRILGMGDVQTLTEKVQLATDVDQAQDLERKVRQGEIDLNDFLQQMQQIKKMGNMKDLMAMIPGMGKALKGIDIDDDAFKHIEAIIHSMTPDERANPSKLNHSRKKRIAKGSGREVQEVNQLLKQFDQMSKMMKMMQGGGGKKMMQMMGGALGRQ